MKQPTNQQIVGGFNRKEIWAFDWIFKNYEEQFYELAAGILRNEMDAEDVTMDVFLKFQQLKERKGTLKEIHNWLYQSTKNQALNLRKKRRLNQTTIAKLAEEQSGITEAEMYRNETAAALYYEIYRCKNKLSPQRQKVFDLYYLEQKSVEEIAQELHITDKTARNSKSIAIRVMKLEIVPRKSLVFLLTLLS